MADIETAREALEALSKRGYVMSGPHLSGWRVTIGFATLEQADAAHGAIVRSAEALATLNATPPKPADEAVRDALKGLMDVAVWDDRITSREQFMVAFNAAEAALLSERPSAEGWRPTHRHVKRGTDYQVIGSASLQAGEPVGEAGILVIYRDAKGRMWARPEVEFDDGRFEPIVAAPPSPRDTTRLPARDLTDAELITEQTRVEKLWDEMHEALIEDGGRGGSPGEWMDERMDEIATEQNRRAARKEAAHG